MSINKNKRNMQAGWCPQASTLQRALGRDSTAVGRISKTFEEVRSEEVRAAILLWAFTGHEPRCEDVQSGGSEGRDRAVDISLRPLRAPLELVEVTQSLDSQYEGAAAAVEQLQRDIGARYRGSLAWSLELDRGWEKTILRPLAPVIAAILNDATAQETALDHGIRLTDLIRAHAVDEFHGALISVTGRNAGAENLKVPYLDELTCYLHEDATVRSKLEKLAADTGRLQASRTHLYVHMASTGRRGGLLPVSPSYLTWGTFEPPAGLTDIWLDSATGTLYHWTQEDGWVFHDLIS